MFNEVVWELHNGIRDKVQCSKTSKGRNSGFVMADNIANVCAFLDAHFHGLYIQSKHCCYSHVHLGPCVDHAPEKHQVRFTRLKWKKMYHDYYLKYCTECNINPVPYYKFVRIRSLHRYHNKLLLLCTSQYNVTDHNIGEVERSDQEGGIILPATFAMS